MPWFWQGVFVHRLETGMANQKIYRDLYNVSQSKYDLKYLKRFIDNYAFLQVTRKWGMTDISADIFLSQYENTLMCTIYAYRDLYHASQSKYDIKHLKRFIDNYALLPVTRKWGMTDISADIFLSQYENTLMCTIYAYRDLYHASQSKYDIKHLKRFIDNYALLQFTRKWGMTDISADIFLSQYENTLMCTIYAYRVLYHASQSKYDLKYLKRFIDNYALLPVTRKWGMTDISADIFLSQYENRLMCTIYAYRDLYHASQSKYDIKHLKRFIDNYALLPVTQKWGMTDRSADIFLSQYENRLICTIYAFVWYTKTVWMIRNGYVFFWRKCTLLLPFSRVGRLTRQWTPSTFINILFVHTMDLLWEKFQWILPLYMKPISF